MTDLIGLVLSMMPIVAPLVWCNLRDRRQQRANGVRADIRAAANGALGGESLIAIQVEPAMRWRAGRVHLSAPGGYEPLIVSVTAAVMHRLPKDYELVLHATPGRA